jgi:hypothetical protein
VTHAQALAILDAFPEACNYSAARRNLAARRLLADLLRMTPAEEADIDREQAEAVVLPVVGSDNEHQDPERWDGGLT